MKKIKVFVVAVLLFSPLLASAQIPVTDLAAIAKMVEQATQMAQDYEQFKQQTQSLTGKLGSNRTVTTDSVMDAALKAAKESQAETDAAFAASGGAPRPDYSKQVEAVGSVIQSVRNVQNGQLANLPTEARRINDMINQSQNASGTLEAQQAGNQINAELVQQIQLQRAQQLSQAQAQNAAALQQQQKEADKAAVTRTFFGK